MRTLNIYLLFDFNEEHYYYLVKFMFFKKAKKIGKIFTVNLTVTTYCQIVTEDFVIICG